MPRCRLDKLLVDRGLAPSRERARALILAGQVEVHGIIVDKAGAAVDPGAPVALRQPDHPYVSRGGLKLAAALEHFGVDPTDQIALDVGASTGGFTDVLLRRGARRVYAIDVGYGQLHWSLRNDPRVVVMERENVRHMAPGRIDEVCPLAVIDVSFISLTAVLAPVVQLMKAPAGSSIVALVKPQFEAGRAQVGKGGVVRDPAARQAAVERVRAWAREHGFAVGEPIESPIRGPAGNIEYLLHLGTPGSPPAPEGRPDDDPAAGS